MDDMQVLHEILAAERAARETVEKARRERVDLQRSLETICRDMEREASAAAQEEIERARRDVLKEAEAALEELDRRYESELSALEERAAAGQELWAEKLFRMVVGLDD